MLREIIHREVHPGHLASPETPLLIQLAFYSQPASRQAGGARLVLDLARAGLVYGRVDALFLNVMPVMAMWLGAARLPWAGAALGKLCVGHIDYSPACWSYSPTIWDTLSSATKR